MNTAYVIAIVLVALSIFMYLYPRASAVVQRRRDKRTLEMIHRATDVWTLDTKDWQ